MVEKSKDSNKILISDDRVFGDNQKPEEIKDFLFSVFGNAPFGIILVDVDNIITLVNAEVIRIFDKNILKEEVINTKIEVFLKGLPDVVETIKYTYKHDKDSFNMATVSYRDKFLSIRGKRFGGGMVIFCDDVTDLRQDETMLKNKLEEQKKIDKMKTEFVTIASHQLRTPLGGIKLFAEALKNGELGELNNEQQSYINDIHESSQRMISLVNNLLNVSRLESGKLEVMPVLIQPEELVQGLIEESIPVSDIEKCHITFRKGDEKFEKIMLDPALVKQVIYNLITNASRYSTKDKCQIYVDLKRGEENDYVISVTDSGIGIPKEEQSRIFEKFYRASDATKLITEGTGIGLYISKMIIDVSGGKIWFNSGGKDKGTTFYISFPINGTGKKKN